MPRQPLVWDPATERYIRAAGSRRTRKPLKGIVGPPRRRSFAEEMATKKPAPQRMSLSGAEKRRKRKGGSPTGGPGKSGGGMRPSTPRSKKGLLTHG